ncbi:MAG: TauD/TfdA family dioxygenase [Gemmatimonadota bacterium]|uniref:TauD/TfdA family dioxygenase n=1 Tax=Candidatus Palauibacter scopulicola TaxID=3056741 RepID=UPI00239845B7|nr:TauD/TfdA family dioxygenase [Candidatus Palauibacter scopulicola]MDE2662596.1 TauD/TfdA family dioxygenase [Candidatus Palauibacter scopulicola]
MGASISSIAQNGDALTAVWSDGTRTDLPYLWLRDNCGCGECSVEQTTEKRFHVFRVPSDLRPATVAIEGGGSNDEAISIAWPDGHRTRYRSSDIRGLLSRPRPALQHWDGEFEPRRFDYHRFLADDSAAAELIEEFLRTGVCVLVDAPTEPDSLEELAPRLGPVREVLFERIHNVKLDPKGYNIAHTALAVGVHNDFTSYTWPPSVQALHMLVNECEGGASTVVDGFGVLEALRREHPDKFDVLCSVPVPFRIFSDEYECYAANPMVDLDSAGEITMIRFNTAQMQAVPLSEPRLGEFYAAYHELSRRVNDAGARVTFRLEGGMILLCAGHRVLHGRTEMVSNGARHLQDAYFEHDNVRTHLRLLRRTGRA